MSYRLMVQGVICMQIVSSLALAQRLGREQWGAPPVRVPHEAGIWMVQGQKNKVALNASDLALRVQGSYLDVFGYVPPTEDFHPEHPVTRTDSMRCRAQCFQWARNNLGIVGTEAGADWVIPYVDYSSGANAGQCISAPLYNLVYHDAIMTPEGGTGDHLRCLLNGDYPSVGRSEESMQPMRQIAALHQRVALLEMTKHEFLDEDYRKERTTFADGTTVTIDRDARTVEIKPELKL